MSDQKRLVVNGPHEGILASGAGRFLQLPLFPSRDARSALDAGADVESVKTIDYELRRFVVGDDKINQVYWFWVVSGTPEGQAGAIAIVDALIGLAESK